MNIFHRTILIRQGDEGAEAAVIGGTPHRSTAAARHIWRTVCATHHSPANSSELTGGIKPETRGRSRQQRCCSGTATTFQHTFALLLKLQPISEYLGIYYVTCVHCPFLRWWHLYRWLPWGPYSWTRVLASRNSCSGAHSTAARCRGAAYLQPVRASHYLTSDLCSNLITAVSHKGPIHDGMMALSVRHHVII